MKEAAIQNKSAVCVTDKVDELLDVLDKDICNIQQSLSWLNELRSLVIKRDEAVLSRLLQKIQAKADGYAANDLKRKSIRKDLADALDCGAEQITLSKLVPKCFGILPEEKKALLNDRRIKLKVLIEQLKKEHLSTVLLLSECVRFNSLLLRAIFDPRSTAGTEMFMYSPSGAAKQPRSRCTSGGSAFVSLQL